MKPSELKDRTRKFSVMIIKLIEKLPKTLAGNAVAEPLVKSGVAVGAKYRVMCRAHNPYDFLSRISECEEAADESLYWLDVMFDSELVPAAEVEPVREEARRLRRIMSKSRRAAAKRQQGEGKRGGSPQDDDNIPF